jgi:hypothetical protein
MTDFAKMFILQTDASGVSVAAVLLQKHDGVGDLSLMRLER